MKFRVRCLLLMTVLMLPRAAAGQWRAIELKIGPDVLVWGAGRTMTFSPKGERLLYADGDQVVVIDTANGKQFGRFRIPNRAIANKALTRGTTISNRVRQLSFTLGGSKLVVVTRGDVWLFDAAAIIDKGTAKPEPLGLPPPQGTDHFFSFVCSVGDDRLVMIDRQFDPEQPREARLVVYRMSTGRLDSGGSVTLATHTVATPQYLSSVYHDRHAFLVGESENGDSLLGLRIIPDQSKPLKQMFVTPIPSVYEKFSISWDERGYGSLKVTEQGKLSTVPAGVTVHRDRFIGLGSKPINRQRFHVTAGIGNIVDGGQPRLIRNLIAEYYQGLGHGGLYSGDGETLVIGDPHRTRDYRETAVTIHDSAGHRLATLQTGRAKKVEVVTISHGGRFVVTNATLHQGRSAREQGMHQRIQLWSLD